MADFLQPTSSLDMWNALSGLAALVGRILNFIEQFYVRKRQAQDAKTKAKADNYDKLQRALKTRGSTRERINTGGLPDDKYRRDE